MPLVSIIIPVYNTYPFLDACIQSVCSQTLTDVEIIIVNDGSTDDSILKCQQWAIKDSRIKIINKSNGGLSSARNEGLKVASSPFIGFIDSDDWIHKEMFQKLYQSITETKSDIAVCGFIIYRKNGEQKFVPNFKCFHSDILEDELLNREIIFPLLGANEGKKNTKGWRAPYVTNRLFKKELIKDIFFKSERQFVSEDLLFNIDLISRIKRISLVRYHLYYWRYNEISLTKSYVANKWKKLFILVDEIKKNIIVQSMEYCLWLQAYLCQSLIYEILKIHSPMNKSQYTEKIKNIAIISKMYRVSKGTLKFKRSHGYTFKFLIADRLLITKNPIFLYVVSLIYSRKYW